jgi:RimJ/RimL family protein N-acetyltransferase
VIGVVSLENVESADGSAMLGYWVATPATRRGAATSAIAQVLTWASEHSDLRRVWALIAPDNVASRRAAEANGFRLVGPVSHASTSAQLRYEVTLRHEPAA